MNVERFIHQNNNKSCVWAPFLPLLLSVFSKMFFMDIYIINYCYYIFFLKKRKPY